MKKSLISKNDKPTRKVQEIQTVVLIVLGAAVVVLACTVAVLLAQVDGHRQSIDTIEQALSIDE